MTADNDLSKLSSAARALVEDAVRLGASIQEVASWSNATVAHMAAPMHDTTRQWLQERFASLRYYRTDGDPHNPPDEGFMDDETATGISFPTSK